MSISVMLLGKGVVGFDPEDFVLFGGVYEDLDSFETPNPGADSEELKEESNPRAQNDLLIEDEGDVENPSVIRGWHIEDFIPKILRTLARKSAYCPCEEPDNSYGGLINCDSGRHGHFDGWFHPSCVGLADFWTLSPKEQDNFEFICDECRDFEEDLWRVANGAGVKGEEEDGRTTPFREKDATRGVRALSALFCTNKATQLSTERPTSPKGQAKKRGMEEDQENAGPCEKRIKLEEEE
ncbi:hypothetical protein AJ80_02659 [Polytolypa hystricis UAMH7299]|uniref:Zinc finger PHD-type domain-containing protein n=1 Tax=Polytolypa hystricis (strain UAMH7299) TaxID=1447883 RepID=A0A2B7YQI2_POLH7|nr:hypothetical protein AJ80_02659 [Polytolypa hystricis UAMH7299]